MITCAPILFWCLMLSVPISPAEADSGPPGKRVSWIASWKEAKRIAKAEGRPILIHFNMDGEPACANMAREHFRDDEIIALSERFVCVVGSLGDHAEEDTCYDAAHPKQCRRFGGLTCAEHRRTEVDARSEVLETSTVTAPQFVFLSPDLDILLRKPWDMPRAQLLDLMTRALEYHDPSLVPSERRDRRTRELGALLERAASDHMERRREALDELAAYDDPAVIRFLLRQTSADVDDVKRNEAIRAIGAAGNSNCTGRLVELLRDRSQQVRRNAIVALGELGMSEAAEPLVAAWGVEPSVTVKALILRVASRLAPVGDDVDKLLSRSLRSAKSDIRVHGVRSYLDRPVAPKAWAKIVGAARGDTDTEVRAVACHAATRLAMDALAREGEAEEWARLVRKTLRPALAKVAAADRSAELRSYARACLAALEGEAADSDDEGDSLESDLSRFHDKGAIFRID